MVVFHLTSGSRVLPHSRRPCEDRQAQATCSLAFPGRAIAPVSFALVRMTCCAAHISSQYAAKTPSSCCSALYVLTD